MVNYSNFISNNSFDFIFDKEELLTELNAKEAQHRLPIRVFLGIVMAIGIIGNCHVLYIYGRFFKKSTYRNFVLTLSAIDMFGCCISMPFEIGDETFPYNFTDALACKIFRYFNTFVALSSGLTLVLVAIERYRKICHPQGRQLSVKASMYCVMTTNGISLVLSSPALHIYGLKTVHLKEFGINGTGCTWRDHIDGTKTGYAYFGTLVLVVISCMAILTVLYSLVGAKLRAHARSMRANVRNKPTEKQIKNVCKRTLKRNLSKSCGDLVEDQEKELGNTISKSCDVLCEGSEIKEKVKVDSDILDKQNSQLNSRQMNGDMAVVQIVNRDLDSARGKGNVHVKQLCNNSAIQSVNDNNNKCSENSSSLNSHRNEQNLIKESNMDDNCVGRNIGNGNVKEKFINAILKIRALRKDSNFHSKDSVAMSMLGKVKNLFKIDDRERRVTKVLFTITVLFILSFLPYIIILLVYVANPRYKDNMTSSEEILYLLGLRLYNVNCAANAALYILFDEKFRTQAKTLYIKCWRYLRK